MVVARVRVTFDGAQPYPGDGHSQAAFAATAGDAEGGYNGLYLNTF